VTGANTTTFFAKLMKRHRNADGVESISVEDDGYSYRWHFDMLHDKERNAAYKGALQGRCDGKFCIDIGTGSGLLALMAGKEGARKVSAYERVDALASVAMNNVHINKLDKTVMIINCHSTEVTSSSSHISGSRRVDGVEGDEKADLLVCELLDTGLIGEGTFASLRHAIEHLLKPGFVSIPSSAVCKVALFHSDTLWLRRVVHGVTLPPNITNCRGSPGPESVNCSSFMERGLLTVLTDVVDAMEFDFTDIPSSTGRVSTCDLKVTGNGIGVAHGVILHWTAVLDKERGISISTYIGTSPPRDHWKQGVFFFPSPLQIEHHEKVLRVSMSHDDDDIWFSTPLPPQEPHESESSGSHCDGGIQRNFCSCMFHTTFTPRRIWMINEEGPLRTFTLNAIRRSIDTMDGTTVAVLDLSDGCFTAVSLAHGLADFRNMKKISIQCLERSEDCFLLSTSIVEYNGLVDVITVGMEDGLDVSNGDNTFHFVIVPPFNIEFEEVWAETTAIVNWYKVADMRRVNPSLVSFPHRAVIKCVLIQCADLWRTLGKVRGPVEGVDVSAMNVLHRGYEKIYSFNLWEICDYKIMSESYSLLTLDYNSDVCDVAEVLIPMKANAEGAVHALCLYVDYECDFNGNKFTLSTGIEAFPSRTSPYVQGLVVLENAIDIISVTHQPGVTAGFSFCCSTGEIHKRFIF
jgi:tRNA1(Val) A37 N6-methylase TrmN6